MPGVQTSETARQALYDMLKLRYGISRMRDLTEAQADDLLRYLTGTGSLAEKAKAQNPESPLWKYMIGLRHGNYTAAGASHQQVAGIVLRAIIWNWSERKFLDFIKRLGKVDHPRWLTGKGALAIQTAMRKMGGES